MSKHRPPELEMTINGEFVEPATVPLSTRILVGAIVIAIVAGALSLAALALWLALLILPIAFGAGVVAYGVFRYRLWRAQQTIQGNRDLWRP
jgi:hypothetical protein